MVCSNALFLRGKNSITFKTDQGFKKTRLVLILNKIVEAFFKKVNVILKKIHNKKNDVDSSEHQTCRISPEIVYE